MPVHLKLKKLVFARTFVVLFGEIGIQMTKDSNFTVEANRDYFSVSVSREREREREKRLYFRKQSY